VLLCENLYCYLVKHWCIIFCCTCWFYSCQPNNKWNNNNKLTNCAAVWVFLSSYFLNPCCINFWRRHAWWFYACQPNNITEVLCENCSCNCLVNPWYIIFWCMYVNLYLPVKFMK
jgi:hypothetical protein